MIYILKYVFRLYYKKYDWRPRKIINYCTNWTKFDIARIDRSTLLTTLLLQQFNKESITVLFQSFSVSVSVFLKDNYQICYFSIFLVHFLGIFGLDFFPLSFFCNSSFCHWFCIKQCLIRFFSDKQWRLFVKKICKHENNYQHFLNKKTPNGLINAFINKKKIIQSPWKYLQVRHIKLYFLFSCSLGHSLL